jgi:hypothetical protein
MAGWIMGETTGRGQQYVDLVGGSVCGAEYRQP